jgi:predicted ArsR family transcriptional regulator
MEKGQTGKILMLLKMRGQATAQLLAGEMGITKEGARKHLLNLAADGLVASTVVSEGVGRPSTYYTLTDKGLAKFPDTHADVTVQLLQSVKKLLGANAVDLLINDREAQVLATYTKAMEKAATLEQKLKILVRKRTEEGYMAEWKKEKGNYLFIENHCPICAAAQECQGFCRSELQVFRQLMGAEYTVQRVAYILEGDQRCVYKIEKAVP